MDEINELSFEILQYALKSLSLEFSYLSYPLGLLNYNVGEIDGKAYTNGKTAVLNGKEVVKAVADKGVKEVDVFILHTLMHCLFLHPFKRAEDIRRYDLATDITVAFVLDGLGYPFGEREAISQRKAVYKSIIDLFGGVNDGFCLE